MKITKGFYYWFKLFISFSNYWSKCWMDFKGTEIVSMTGSTLFKLFEWSSYIINTIKYWKCYLINRMVDDLN